MTNRENDSFSYDYSSYTVSLVAWNRLLRGLGKCDTKFLSKLYVFIMIVPHSNNYVTFDIDQKLVLYDFSVNLSVRAFGRLFVRLGYS